MTDPIQEIRRILVMTPTRVLAALLTFLCMVTVGCSVEGRMAEKLDRPTALALLKEKEDELMNVPPYHGRWAIVPVVLEVRVSRPTLGTFHPNPEKEEASEIANMRGELEVRNALVDVGLLKRQVEKDIKEPTVNVFDVGAKTTRYVYYFSVVPQPGVAFSQAPEGGTATFELAKGAFTSVTGVLQQGIDAEVEAQVTYSPTTLYERLLFAEKKMQEKLGSGDLSNVFRDRYWNDLHNTQVRGAETRQYQFRRYDDGWRLVRRLR